MSIQQWLEVLGTAECFDLTHPWCEGMPAWADPFHYWMGRRHGDIVKQENVSLATDTAFWPMHTGTHVDALGHYSENGRLFGGVDAAAAQAGGQGLSQRSVEEIPLRFEHARIVDARQFPPERPITADALEKLCGAQHVEICSGDILLIATGWDQQWSDPGVYLGSRGYIPGLDPDAVDWAHARGVKSIGTDTALVEFWPNQGELHRRALVWYGMWLIENLVLTPLCQASAGEVLLCVFPIPVQGATGVPARIVALAPKGRE